MVAAGGCGVSPGISAVHGALTASAAKFDECSLSSRGVSGGRCDSDGATGGGTLSHATARGGLGALLDVAWAWVLFASPYPRGLMLRS